MLMLLGGLRAIVSSCSGHAAERPSGGRLRIVGRPLDTVIPSEARNLGSREYAPPAHTRFIVAALLGMTDTTPPRILSFRAKRGIWRRGGAEPAIAHVPPLRIGGFDERDSL